VPDPSINVLWNGYLQPDCVKANPDDPQSCNSVNIAYPYIHAPLYIAENKFDTNQIFTQLGCPQNASDTNDYIAYFGKLMQQSVEQIYSTVMSNSLKKNDGLFFMSCLNHTSDTHISSPTLVQGILQGDSIVDWYFEGGKVPHVLVDDCKGDMPCNPTCV